MADSDEEREHWFADTVERLFHDFEDRYPLTVILATTRQCRTELEGSGSPPSALPELVERLARQRLTPQRNDSSA